MLLLFLWFGDLNLEPVQLETCQLTSYVRQVEGKWFGFVIDQDLKIHTKHRYTYLAQELEFDVNESGPVIRKKPLKFFKITEKQRDLHLSYKKCWLIYQSGTWLAMNQLEPNIYTYTPEAIFREHEIAENLPSSSPFTAVPLKGSVPLPSESCPFDLITSPQLGMKVLRHWLASWSEILYFGKVQNGFMVGYTVPTHTFDNRLNGTLLELPQDFQEDGRLWIVQLLDRELVPVGGPRYLGGAGLFFNNDEQVYFFELNQTEKGIAPRIVSLNE